MHIKRGGLRSDGPKVVCLCLHIKKGKDHFDTFNAHFIFAQFQPCYGDSQNRIRIKHIAFKGSTGTFTDFIQIYMNGKPIAAWNALKNELAQRVIDGQHAFKLLRQVK